jgi:2-oxoisovalerate dehydrogenase E1 component
VLYVVEDNGYAISTPVEANTPGGNISRLIANFPNFHFAEVDGTDAIASYEAMVEAVAYCRAGNGPRAGPRPRHSALLPLAERR